jgi:hypothetical protein
MSEKPEQAIAQEPEDGAGIYISDALIEQIWRDLKGQVDHKRIYQVALMEAAGFKNATVTNFISIFIRRQTCERLRATFEK